MKSYTFILFVSVFYVLLNSMDCGGKERQGIKGKSKHVGGPSDHGHVEHHEYAAKYALSEDLPENLRLKIIDNSPDEDNYYEMLTKAVTNKNLYNLDERALMVRELAKRGNFSVVFDSFEII